MEQLIQAVTLLLILVIPWLVSTHLWPRLQGLVPYIKTLPNTIQQSLIVVLNASIAVLVGLVVPDFGPLALGIGAAGVGGVTTLSFKTGKIAGELSPRRTRV